VTRINSLARAAGCLAAVLLILPATGCDGGKSKGPKVIVRGKLLNKGAPIVLDNSKLPPGDSGVQVVFHPMDGGSEVSDETATFDTVRSTFELRGLDGKGIPVGKYKVSVHIGAFGVEDQFKGKFSPQKSTIVRDVTGKNGDTVDLTIDLDNPNG
jgi:hypothetical protein